MTKWHPVGLRPQLSQFLFGHGHFNTYWKRFKLADSESYGYCGARETHGPQLWQVGYSEAGTGRTIGSSIMFLSMMINLMMESAKNLELHQNLRRSGYGTEAARQQKSTEVRLRQL